MKSMLSLSAVEMGLSLCFCGTMAAQSVGERSKMPDAPPGYGVDASGFQLLTGSKHPGAGKIRDEERIYLEVRQKWYLNPRTRRLEDHGTTVLECAIPGRHSGQAEVSSIAR